MDKLKQKALSLGATEFGQSNMKGKRFYVRYLGKKIHFGAKGGQTFLDHTKIRDKQGRLVHKLKTSPSFWSKTILW